MSTEEPADTAPPASPEPPAPPESWEPGERLRTTSLPRRITAAASLAARAAPAAFAAHALLTLVTGTAPVATAWLMKLVVDNLVQRGPLSTLLGLASGLAAVGVATAMLPQFVQYLRGELDRRVGLLTQDRLFTATGSFIGLGRFEDPRFLDRLRLAQPSVGMNPNDVVGGVLSVVRAVLTLTGFLGSLFLLGPVMAVLLLLSGLLVLAAEISLSRRRARMIWEVGPVERREFFYNDLLSSVEAAKEIRLFGSGGFLRARMLTERRTANAAKRAMDRRDITVQAGLATLAAAVSGAGLVWAVVAAQRGALSVGDVTVFVAAVGSTQGALATIAGELARSHQALELFDHYLAVTTARPDLPVAAEPRPLPVLRRGITLQDVWFRYSPGHPWVLQGVTLHIPHGKALALVGLNGAGKSTLVKLLCRFYDPTRGAILWDGVDIREADAAELRRRIGAVFQDYMHYDMTAAENIALGDLTALDDTPRLRAAAVRAGIHAAISELPRGYDTLLSRTFFMTSDSAPEPVPGTGTGTGTAPPSEPIPDTAPQPDTSPAGPSTGTGTGTGISTGAEFSGGQRQRLALARAFLRDRCELMILDEPSAGLDAAAEHEIHVSLRRHRQGRTSLLISHRLGAVRDADLIVVLSEGRIVEQGDHAALLASGGEYARLFALQASGYRDELQSPPVPLHPLRTNPDSDTDTAPLPTTTTGDR
ncbi:ABC transporter ATP-binding protein [Streptomyces chrestomyceticus]|uniref:ABC transporter ATP-binding protein n=2 Tax=Streptomyces chrestomyceticus TaxID=68185 RepID=UPI0033EB6931